MTVSKDRRELYENMCIRDKVAVDEAYRASVAILIRWGLNVQDDDRAENLVGAIARFVEDCKR